MPSFKFLSNFLEHQHNRFNPLTGQWVLVSPHRLQRPWSGQSEASQIDNIPEFDPTNPLCPGTTRPNGEVRMFNTRFFFKLKLLILLKYIYLIRLIPNMNQRSFFKMISRRYWRIHQHHLPVMIPFFRSPMQKELVESCASIQN